MTCASQRALHGLDVTVSGFLESKLFRKLRFEHYVFKLLFFHVHYM